MRHLVLLALGLVGFPAAALTNVDLYQTEIVLDQSVENADAQARVDGMKEIIVRASGDQSAVSNQVVQKALKQNSQYLSQISYGQLDGQQTLRLGFSAPHIRSLLSQAQLPIWPAARANLLVWLVEETQYDRNISWEHSDSPVLGQMRVEAEKRGLPLTVPVGDFDDITGVAASDLWGGFARPVGEASQRYPVDAVLVVRVQGNSLRWTLYDQKPATIGITRQAPVSGSNSGADSATKMVNQISDYYAKKSAVVVASESSETVKVRFTSLNNAVDFFTLEKQLKKLSSVAATDILKIQGNQVTFNVHLLASQAEFEQEVSRMGQVTQLENITESQPVVIDEPQIEAPDDSVSGAQPNIDTPVEVPAVIPSEQILTFEWLGAPATEIEHEAELIDSEEAQEALEDAIE
ncbi:DUF2066 domain-containing protein [Vibrio coralliilyticus]|uniref:DUF2066 domain-containing protein n=1 Tax=Vibrio coralliilyticus TaxID=190893 RepID=A0AAN0VXL6_9VIBR|nr:DUF2066 domain-containing protein [Vibrio coralliilyticus]AIW19565.1 hypothetical protein IX92_11045 [Vibrio coralliilyticus]NOH39450.1 DUF2066 domain-containing protein [Vibrio coralliilyticus]